VDNTLRVDSSGSTFTFYINGQYITTVTDSTWAEGRLTFFGSSETTPVDYYLDYVRVCNN
jgi:hypothetical protein